jgi:sialic acid synthase SpsE
MSFYVFSETAFHHEGNKDYLLKLVDAAKLSGASGIKFQVLIDLNEFMSSKHSAFDEAKSWVLSESDWKEVFSYTRTLGLDIILMPLDIKAFELVNEFEIKYVEIHSVSFKDQVLLKSLDQIDTPLIFGIGGRTKAEIDYVVEKYNDRNVTLMVGFQSFPTVLKDAKLLKIKELSNIYPTCTIGYADHSAYDSEEAINSNEYAYILGARVFEKHITVDEGKERIDYQSAVCPEKLKQIIGKLTSLEKALKFDGNSLFDLSDAETNYRNRQKVPVAKYNIMSGEILSQNMIALKMIDCQDNLEDLEDLIGKKTNKNIEANRPFFIKDIV